MYKYFYNKIKETEIKGNIGKTSGENLGTG
jgi:hypothetical protein